MRQPSASAGTHGSGQPQGSMVDRQPARMVVVVRIRFSWGDGGAGASSHRRGVDELPASGRGWRVSPAPAGAVQPFGSIAEPAPARSEMRMLIVHLLSCAVLRHLQPPCGSMPFPSPARTCVVVPISASVGVYAPAAAVGVDGAAACGAQGGGDGHRDAPCQPLSSMRRPAPARMVAVVLMARSPECGVDAERRRKCCLSISLNARERSAVPSL